MNEKTIERLYAAGWQEERNINIDKLKTRYHEIGLNMPPNVQSFLAKYGMIEVNAKDKTYFDVTFDPLKAIGVNLDGGYFRECLAEYGMKDMVYPVGVACRENLLVLMTETDTVYCFTDGCLLKAGDNINDMLDCLVGECREGELID